MFFGGVVYAPRWSWPLRSQSGFPRWPRPLRSPSPSWSSCPPSYRSQPFLSAFWMKMGAALLELCSISAPNEANEGSLPWLASWALLPALPELVSVAKGGKEGKLSYDRS